MDQDVESAGSFTEVLRLQSGQVDADAKLMITFEEVEVEDPVKSKEAGRPIFRTRHIGNIHVPGDRDVVTFDPERMDPEQRRRFGKRYAAWKADRTERVEGTLLRECGGLMSRARAREWEALHVFTVEQLAGLSDQNVQNMQGAILERQHAKDFLAAAAGRAPLAEARAANEKMAAQLKALQEQVQSLTQLLEQKTEPTRKGK